MDDYVVIEEYRGYEIIEYQNEYYVRYSATGRIYGTISESIHHAKRFIDRLEKR